MFLLLSLLGAGYSARYEAEDATLTDATVQSSESGYSGTGYVQLRDSGSIKFTVTISSAGFYNLIIGYAGIYGEKRQNVHVNGESIGEVYFAETTGFVALVAAKKISLKAGTNTIEIIPSWGWDLFDYIDFEAYQDSPFTISDSPVTANPTASAKRLWTFLKAQFQKGMISGVMTLQGSKSDSQKENNWVHDTTGKYPALIGLDFMQLVGKDSSWYADDPVISKLVVTDAVDYWNRGGIPALMWHWRDPSHDTNEFYSPSSGNDATQFDVREAVKQGTAQYTAVIRDLDIVAAQLLEIQQAGAAAIWRPLHEAAGGWFWWGYHGAEPAKALYKIIYDRFVNHHKITNLIWAWTVDAADSALDWYPGDDVVDVVGMDIYPDAGDHASQSSSFEKVKDLFKGKKIIALTECGSIPDAAEAKKAGAAWSWFMPWYRDYTIPQGGTPHNSEAFWKTLMASDYVISLDEMPGWK
jgi:mannan endo-1,4-beta-mannosidase